MKKTFYAVYFGSIATIVSAFMLASVVSPSYAAIVPCAFCGTGNGTCTGVNLQSCAQSTGLPTFCLGVCKTCSVAGTLNSCAFGGLLYCDTLGGTGTPCTGTQTVAVCSFSTIPGGGGTLCLWTCGTFTPVGGGCTLKNCL